MYRTHQNKGSVPFLMAVVLMFTTTVTRATTYTISYVWSSASDPNVNKLAGQCSYTYPDNQPFSVPRSVVADNSVPAGTILASWSYADLNVPLSVSCSGSGIEGTTRSSLLHMAGLLPIQAASPLWDIILRGH